MSYEIATFIAEVIFYEGRCEQAGRGVTSVSSVQYYGVEGEGVLCREVTTAVPRGGESHEHYDRDASKVDLFR